MDVLNAVLGETLRRLHNASVNQSVIDDPDSTSPSNAELCQIRGCHAD